MRVFRSLGLLVCLILAFNVRVASAHVAIAQIDCSSVTFGYALFSKDPPANTITETVSIDGTVVINKVFTFPTLSSKARDVVMIKLPDAGPHTVTATAVWSESNDGNSGNYTITQVLSGCPVACTPGTPDPSRAHASGSSFGLNLTAPLGINLLKQPKASSSQSGVGSNSDQAKLGAISIPATAITKASTLTLMSVDSNAVVTDLPAAADDRGVAETVGVNLLGGFIKADTVRADVEAIAAGDHASFSDAASTFQNLVINGVQYTNVAPNTKISVPGLGTGAYVILRERIASTSTPAAGQLSGGSYAANVTVNMIHVVIPGLLGLPATELIVSHAQAHADFPQTTICTQPTSQSVSGHAFVASTNLAGLAPVLVGYADIPSTGGAASVSVNGTTLPGTLGGLGAATASSQGTLNPASSVASSKVTIANASLLSGAVQATVIQSQSNSNAVAGTASSDAAGTQLLNISVAGKSIADNPKPNTVVKIPGIGYVVFNEQIVDAPSAGHTGLTVRSLRVHINQLAGIVPGTEIIIGEAHSDAQFGP